MEPAEGAAATLPCDECGGPFEQPSVPHAWKPCPACARPVYTLPGPNGLTVEDGATVAIPAGWLRLSLDRALSTGRFFRPGITWYVKALLGESQPKDSADLMAALDRYKERATEVLSASERLAGLDLDDEAQAVEALSRIEGHDRYPEWWAELVGGGANLLKGRIEAGAESAEVAIVAQRLAFAWAMLIFTQHLEPLVWRGYQSSGVEAMQHVLALWEANQTNRDEDFWHGIFSDYPFVLSQVLPHPIVVVQGQAYVGGKTVDNTGGHLTDFLLSQALTANVALLELKTPMTKLLGARYRTGVYAPSSQLSGAVAQVAAQRDSLVSERRLLLEGQPESLTAFNPACIVLAGTSGELDTLEKRRSFELYRSGLAGTTVITYDELFRNVQGVLAAVRGD